MSILLTHLIKRADFDTMATLLASSTPFKLVLPAFAVLALLATAFGPSCSGSHWAGSEVQQQRMPAAPSASLASLDPQEQDQWQLATCQPLQQVLPPDNVTRPIQPALLHAALRARDATNKIILTFGNAAAYINLFPAMLESMRVANASGMPRHLVAITTSTHALELCSRFHGNCVLDNWATSLHSAPDDESQGQMTSGYLSLVCRKPELVRDLVNANISVVCIDMDIVDFRNFLQSWVLPYSSGADLLLLQSQRMLEDDPEYYVSKLNAGFYFIRASLQSKTFLNTWLHRDLRTGCGNEQTVMGFSCLRTAQSLA